MDDTASDRSGGNLEARTDESFAPAPEDLPLDEVENDEAARRDEGPYSPEVENGTAAPDHHADQTEAHGQPDKVESNESSPDCHGTQTPTGEQPSEPEQPGNDLDPTEGGRSAPAEQCSDECPSGDVPADRAAPGRRPEDDDDSTETLIREEAAHGRERADQPPGNSDEPSPGDGRGHEGHEGRQPAGSRTDQLPIDADQEEPFDTAAKAQEDAASLAPPFGLIAGGLADAIAPPEGSTDPAAPHELGETSDSPAPPASDAFPDDSNVPPVTEEEEEEEDSGTPTSGTGTLEVLPDADGVARTAASLPALDDNIPSVPGNDPPAPTEDESCGVPGKESDPHSYSDRSERSGDLDSTSKAPPQEPRSPRPPPLQWQTVTFSVHHFERPFSAHAAGKRPVLTLQSRADVDIAPPATVAVTESEVEPVQVDPVSGRVTRGLVQDLSVLVKRFAEGGTRASRQSDLSGSRTQTRRGIDMDGAAPSVGMSGMYGMSALTSPDAKRGARAAPKKGSKAASVRFI